MLQFYNQTDVPSTEARAARMLIQATFGPTRTSVDGFRSRAGARCCCHGHHAYHRHHPSRLCRRRSGRGLGQRCLHSLPRRRRRGSTRRAVERAARAAVARRRRRARMRRRAGTRRRAGISITTTIARRRSGLSITGRRRGIGTMRRMETARRSASTIIGIRNRERHACCS